MAQRIRRFGVGQTAKVFAGLDALLGLVCVPFILLAVLVAPDEAGVGIGFAMAFPLLYGLAGLVFTAIGRLLYNLVASLVGGIEIEIGERTTGLIGPVHTDNRFVIIRPAGQRENDAGLLTCPRPASADHRQGRHSRTPVPVGDANLGCAPAPDSEPPERPDSATRTPAFSNGAVLVSFWRLPGMAVDSGNADGLAWRARRATGQRPLRVRTGNRGREVHAEETSSGGILTR